MVWFYLILFYIFLILLILSRHVFAYCSKSMFYNCSKKYIKKNIEYIYILYIYTHTHNKKCCLNQKITKSVWVWLYLFRFWGETWPRPVFVSVYWSFSVSVWVCLWNEGRRLLNFDCCSTGSRVLSVIRTVWMCFFFWVAGQHRWDSTIDFRIALWVWIKCVIQNRSTNWERVLSQQRKCRSTWNEACASYMTRYVRM